MSKPKGYAEKKGVFVKSIPDHGLGLNGADKNGKLIIKQTTEHIFETLTLQPNTRSFGLEERICFSHLFSEEGLPEFKDSYRNSGIAFKYRDGDQQDLFFPCDLLALSRLAQLPVSKTELFANLQRYYQTKVIKNRKLFGTESIDDRVGRIHSTAIMNGEPATYDEILMELVNEFRGASGYKPLSVIDHNRLISHNECIKFSPVKIDILGVFGTNQVLNQKAKTFGILSYPSSSSFIEAKYIAQ